MNDVLRPTITIKVFGGEVQNIVMIIKKCYYMLSDLLSILTPVIAGEGIKAGSMENKSKKRTISKPIIMKGIL